MCRREVDLRGEENATAIALACLWRLRVLVRGHRHHFIAFVMLVCSLGSIRMRCCVITGFTGLLQRC